MRYLRAFTPFVLTATLLLSGCMSRMSHEVEDLPAGTAFVQDFVRVLARGDRDGIMARASTPFWIEEWNDDLQDVRDQMPEDEEEMLMEILKTEIRIYPVGDLAAIDPEAWQALEDTSDGELSQLYVAVVGLYFEDEDPEEGLLLLRRINGKWSLAGVIED